MSDNGRFAPGEWIAFVKETTSKWGEVTIKDPFGSSIDGCLPSLPPEHRWNPNVLPFRKRPTK